MTEMDYNSETDEDREQYINQNVVLLEDVGDAPFSFFSIHCPACGERVCQIDIGQGTVEGFEAVCSECGVAFFPSSGAAVGDQYHHWHDDEEESNVGSARRESVTPSDLRRRVTESWEAELRDGITMEQAVDPYETKEVDITASMADEYQYRGQEFGWSWTPPEHLLAEDSE